MFKKIDLYYNGDYICSTNQSKTCKEAKANYLARYKDKAVKDGLPVKDISKLLKAYFDKSK